MTSTSNPSHDDIATALAQDRPTIDTAVKSFLSLYAARSLTRDDAPAQQESLTQARLLLKTINRYTFPLQPEPTDEYNVTAQVWNGLIASQQKPSKFMGRTALKLAWQHGLPEEVPKSNDEHDLFLQEFGSLLMEYDPNQTPIEDRDACLVWDNDKGAAELGRRRSRRAERAKEQSESLTIEELPDEEEAKDEGTPTMEELPGDGKETATE